MLVYTYEPDDKPYLVEVEFSATYMKDSDFMGEFVDLDSITLGEITYHDEDGDVSVLTESELEDMVGHEVKEEIDRNITKKALEE